MLAISNLGHSNEFVELHHVPYVQDHCVEIELETEEGCFISKALYIKENNKKPFNINNIPYSKI